MQSPDSILCYGSEGSGAEEDHFQDSSYYLARFEVSASFFANAKDQRRVPSVSFHQRDAGPLGLIQPLIDLIIGAFDLERQHAQLSYICLVTVAIVAEGYGNSAPAHELEGMCERQVVEMHGLHT